MPSSRSVGLLRTFVPTSTSAIAFPGRASRQLPARKVGTRRRLAFEDLLRFDEQQRARQRAALDELARIDAEFGL